VNVEEKIAAMGLELPPPARPVGSYVPAVRTGALIYTSGQLPTVGGEPRYRGKVGQTVTLEQAQDAARLCALNALGALRAELGDLDRIRRIIKVTGFVNCGPDFTEQAAVLNGASNFLQDALGDAGRHARAAVGCVSLPLGCPVEVELIAEVAE